MRYSLFSDIQTPHRCQVRHDSRLLTVFTYTTERCQTDCRKSLNPKGVGSVYQHHIIGCSHSLNKRTRVPGGESSKITSASEADFYSFLYHRHGGMNSTFIRASIRLLFAATLYDDTVPRKSSFFGKASIFTRHRASTNNHGNDLQAHESYVVRLKRKWHCSYSTRNIYHSMYISIRRLRAPFCVTSNECRNSPAINSRS